MNGHPTPLPPEPVPAELPSGRRRSERWLTAAAGLAVCALGMLAAGTLGAGTAPAPWALAALGVGVLGLGALLVARVIQARTDEELYRSLEQHSTVLGQLSQPVAVIIDQEIQFANAAWSRWREHRLGDRMNALLALPQGEGRVPGCEALPALQVELRRVRVQWAGRAAELVQVQDLTESRQLQAQVVGRDRLAQIGLLAAGVAHEINNPLMAVTTYLEMIEEEVAHDPGLLEMVDDLGQALGHIQEVANDLRMLGRAEGGRVEAIDPWEPVRAAARLTRAQGCGDMKIVEEGEELPPVLGTHGRLVQVFLNLFLNAAHSAAEAGVSDPWVCVRGRCTADAVELTVQDNGGGVPEALRDAIFEAQFTTRDRDRGTGLGLWLCRRTLEELEGSLELGRSDQPGAVFVVRLQRADAGCLERGLAGPFAREPHETAAR